MGGQKCLPKLKIYAPFQRYKMKGKIKKAMAVCAAGCMFMLGFGACVDSPQTYEEEGNVITFDYNDGFSRPYTVIVDDSDSAEEPETPLREGYKFIGWTTEKDGGTAIEFPYTPSGDQTLYAAWEAEKYNVVFNFDYDNNIVEQQCEYDSQINAPEAPEREGWTLYEWRINSSDGAVAHFPYTVKRDVTFYANWTNNSDIITVQFDFGYQPADPVEPIEPLTLISGESIRNSDLPEPERNGYTLEGWSLTPGGEPVDMPFRPDGNCTLYAVWEEVTYTVVFWTNYVDNNVMFDTKTAVGGGAIEAPEEEPVREGYIFDGWYGSAKGGERIEFPYTPSDDTRIYAHWKHTPVETNIFQAEYVEFDSNELFPGYSGENRGDDIIVQASSAGVLVDNDYPLSNAQQAVGHQGFVVSYLYKRGATLTFVINSSEDVQNASLKVNVGIESQQSATFGPTGLNAWKVSVNGQSLNYTPFTLSISGPVVAGSSRSDFTLVTLGNISLKKGENIIQLVTDNDNAVIGGTTRANAPMVDYIRIDNYGSAVLSWSPVYDNLY